MKEKWGMEFEIQKRRFPPWYESQKLDENGNEPGEIERTKTGCGIRF
jgi:hypothetical protein